MKQFLFTEILNRFYSKGKIKFYFLFLLSLIAGLFEYMGLVLIFQFVLFLSNPSSVYCVNILNFFEKYFDISDISKISLLLGITIASVYIFKNIYMLIFTRINNSILQDLSVKITVKIMKELLFQDYLKTIKYSNEQKINIVSKVAIVVWQYCQKYINLIINSVIAAMLLFYLFIKFTIPALVATVFIGLLSYVEYKYLKKNSNLQNTLFSNAFNDMNGLLIKSITMAKEIKLNNKQNYFIDMIQDKCVDYASLNKDRSFFDIFHIYFTEISVMFSFIIVLCILFYTTNFDNQILITSISTICVIILRLTPLINRIQSCLYSINSNKNITQELINFNDVFDKNFDYSIPKNKMEFKKAIRLKNVSFSYNEYEGLKNINLEIKKGEFIGIVGASGCYKTTLSLIISSLIRQKEGEIFIDDVKLNNSNCLEWQNNVALLGQDYNLLFDKTSEINNAYFEKLDLENMNQEVKNLSHGQKQRVALANLLTQNKEIIILDEISSSSDVITEDMINDILLSLKGNKTIISIAHRLQILKYCDRIIFMENGNIIDIDTFKNLSIKYDKFKKIVELSNFKID